MISLGFLEVSYNQPKFSPCATWIPSDINFADFTPLGATATGLFITTNNTIYATGWGLQSIYVWPEGSVSSTQSIFSDLSSAYRVFVTINGDVYVDNGAANHTVRKWATNATSSTTVMIVNGDCNGLFVDIYDSLYCSTYVTHTVLRKVADSDANTSAIVAGNSTPGLASNMLAFPCGIFVDIDLSLYVADSGNHRVQVFRSGQLNGATVAGNGASGTILLKGPGQVALDGDGYVFIVDSGNFRIVGSGPNGFRCIAACSGRNGSAANELLWPYDIRFDSHGNLFVADTSINGIRKFTLARNSCGELCQATLCRRI